MKFKQDNDYILLMTKLMFTDAHKLMIAMLERYVNLNRSTTAESQLSKWIFDNIEAQALTMLSVCTLHGSNSPIQSIIGSMSSALLTKNRDAGKVIATYTCVAEFVTISPEIFIPTFTYADARKCKSIFYDEKEAKKKLFQLPSMGKPTKNHKHLGRFQWNRTTSEAIDKLNHIPLCVMNFEETSIPLEGSEERVKYDIRSILRPAFAKDMTKLYFQWNDDYRGRMYPSGYHFNVQGNEYEKNIFRFANAIKIDNIDDYRTCELAIIRAIAFAFGENKIIDELKYVWFEEHENNLDWRLAEEPTYARAQLQALKELREHDLISIPIELDATNSQKQIISVLTGDLRTAASCNIVTDNTYIQDAYRLVAEEMSRLTGFKFDRSQIKKSDMIDGYGAGKERVTKQLQSDLRELFSESSVEAFYTASNTVCPTVTILKSTFQALWDDSRTTWSWTLPDGFVVTYRTTETRVIKLNPFNTGEFDIILTMIMPTSKNTGLGVNIIHSIDSYVARQMIMRCPFEVITIHDGFRCLPLYVDIMQQTYNEIMADIVDSTLLQDIVKELSGIELSITKEFTGKHVMNSKYSIS